MRQSKVAPHTTQIPIPGLSVAHFHTVFSLNVFPQPLEIEHLKRSIATLTSVVPTLCARYKARTAFTSNLIGHDQHRKNGRAKSYYLELCLEPIPFQQSKLIPWRAVP